ncbi:MAG: hypothetical protein ACYSU3_04030 [Planctomycetota bacterium]|jgi:hypothetical protein
MVRQIKSNLPLFVTLVLLIFAMHFIAGMVCRVNPDPKVSDRFDAYLKPGILVLLAPFLFLSKLSTHRWGHGDILGVFVYLGAMFLYSLLLTVALFGIYELLRKVIVWRHQNKVIVCHRGGFSSGG